MNPNEQITKSRRVVIIYWKDHPENPFQVFSNLKNFCASYPKYNYNTLNNYLSKDKTAYENDQVRIERKSIITDVVKVEAEKQPGRIARVVKKGMLKEMDQDHKDLEYWHSRPVCERAAAVTFIISQSLTSDQRMDKTIIHKRKLHES